MHWLDALATLKAALAALTLVARAALAVQARRSRTDDPPGRAGDAVHPSTPVRWAKVVMPFAQAAGALLTVVEWLHGAGLL